MTLDVYHYTDLKSPYAYLAFDPIMALAQRYDINLITRPYTLDIPSYLGAVVTRDDHQWRRVKYSYADCRRMANERGLTLYGPKKIFDTRQANIAMMYADQAGLLEAYVRAAFISFFKREFDPENPERVAEMLKSVGVDTADFDDYANGAGGVAHDRCRDEAEEMGVFGVPMLVIDGDLFWGGDRIAAAETRLQRLLT